MEPSITERIIEQLNKLPSEQQWRVYEFTRALSLSKLHGVSGQQLLRFAGTIPLSDVRLMEQPIEQACEQVNTHEW
jgi:hypothetical protein